MLRRGNETMEFPGNTLYGTAPEPYEIEEDRAGGALVLRTPFYAIEHDLRAGGAIRAIRLFQGSGENLLLAPMGCEVVLEGDARVFSTLSDSSPRVDVSRDGERVRVDVAGVMRSPEGESCGVEYQIRYEYRWGAIRLCQRFRFPGDGARVRRLTLLQWKLRPELGSFAVRPGAPAEASAWLGAFGVCQWGRFTPGASFDCPYESRFVPRYVACAEQGREGLEWFAGSKLSQWDYQACGRPGYGHLYLGPQSRPPAVVCTISPVNIPSGAVPMAGDYTFDSWLGIPALSGRAHRPFLHRSFNRHDWPTREKIRAWAEAGVRTAHFHHDGDTFRDGLFWRDGSYPPFGPEDMKEYDRVIRELQEHGIRVATYFSNKELHPTTAAYQAHGAEWARLPGERGQQLHNAYAGDEYGAQMCLRSGWLAQLKENIDTVLRNHPLDGVYYDWNVALYCHNPAHEPDAEPGELPDYGGWALSPVGHWDVDELVELMEWTRQRVGRDGLVIIHNTMVPCAVTENLADYVVAMEWGYGRLATAAPPLASLPLEWSFMGARPRGVIGYGCLERDAPESVHRQMTLRCLLTGTAPWPAQDLDLELFAPLRDYDLSQYRFYDWRSAPVRLEEEGVAAAAYIGAREALVVVGNLTGEARTARGALASGESFAVELPPDGATVVRIPLDR